MKRDFIKQKNVTDFTYMGNRFQWVDQEMGDTDTAKSLLNNIANDVKADVCVVGYHGRKGPKADPTVMGSAVQYMSVQAKTPVLIVKDFKTRDDRPDGFTYGVLLDGSLKSNQSMDLLIRMVHPNDKIVGITVEQNNVNG